MTPHTKYVTVYETDTDIQVVIEDETMEGLYGQISAAMSWDGHLDLPTPPTKLTREV